MKDFESFNIKVHNRYYIIKPYCNMNCMLYEVFTNCDKLFTIKKTNHQNWITDEKDVIPIYFDIVDDIGMALEEYEVSQEL